MLWFSRFRRSVTYELIFYILIFSGLITLVITALQLVKDYHDDIDEIHREFRIIEESYVGTLTSALWVYNDDLIQVQMEGMAHLRDIAYLELHDTTEMVISAGTPVPEKMSLTHIIPLIYSFKEEERELGNLLIVASLEGVYQRLQEKFWFILISHGGKTFLVSLFMFTIFQQVVTKHLKTISDYMQQVRMDRPSPPLKLRRSRWRVAKQTELDLLADNINDMVLSLSLSFSELDQKVRELNCLYKVSRATENFQNGLQNTLQQIVEEIPRAFLSSEQICARIMINGDDYQTRNYLTESTSLHVNIVAGVKQIGFIEACQLDGPGRRKFSSALLEKRVLIEIIADRIGKMISYREAEARIRERNAFVEAVTGNLPVGVAVYDRQSGGLTYMNPQFETICGCTREQLASFDELCRLFYPAGTAAARDTCSRNDGTHFSPELHQETLEFQRGSGETAFVEFQNTTQSDLNMIIVTVTDVTSRITAEKESEEMNRLFTTFMDNLPAGAMIKDEQGIVRYVNPYYHKEHDADTWIGKDARAYLPAQLGEQAFQDDRYVLSRGLRVRHWRFPDKRGEERHYQVWKFPIPRERNKKNLGVIAVDMTERILAEQERDHYRRHLEQLVEERTAALRAANEELSQYAYAVSHDLKAPLRAIHNYAKFLREDLEDVMEPEQSEYLDEMFNAIRQGKQLVDDILLLSRIGRADHQVISVDTGAALRELIHTLDLDAEFEFLQEDWPVLALNLVLFRQIFTNLFTNAVKFNQSPRKRVTLGWRRTGSGFAFSVSDNGIGIAPEYQDRIFHVFERLHTGAEYEGTGVGLTIVKRAVIQMGGDIRLISETGRGSTFLVTLKPVRNPSSSPENRELQSYDESNGSDADTAGRRQPA